MRNGKCRLDVFWWSGTFPSQRAVVYLQTANKMDWWSGECTTATARCVLTYRSTPRRRPSTPFYLRTCGSWYIDARIYQYMFPLIVTRKKRANKQSHFEKTKQKNCGIRRRFRFPPSVSTQYRLLKYKRTVKFRCWQKYFIIVWQNNISTSAAIDLVDWFRFNVTLGKQGTRPTYSLFLGSCPIRRRMQGTPTKTSAQHDDLRCERRPNSSSSSATVRWWFRWQSHGVLRMDCSFFSFFLCCRWKKKRPGDEREDFVRAHRRAQLNKNCSCSRLALRSSLRFQSGFLLDLAVQIYTKVRKEGISRLGALFFPYKTMLSEAWMSVLTGLSSKNIRRIITRGLFFL